MSSPIDPPRRSGFFRRLAKFGPDRVEDEDLIETTQLPVPVERVTRPPPPRDRRSGGLAAFAAQLLGQDGQKRGLRAGPELADQAKQVYNRTEWSGSKDRRRKGGKTSTEI